MLVAAAVLGSCERKTQFIQRDDDDSTAAGADSLESRMRDVQRGWDTGTPSEDLAGTTAGLLRDALADRPPADWARRAQRLLDSLGVGAEISSGDCVVAANFFDRADPDAGSWPYLFWCGADGPRVQSVEGRGLRLAQVVVRGVSAPAASARKSGASSASGGTGPGPGVAALFQRRAAGGLQPMLIVWAADTTLTKWKMVQTLGSDSLGGVGTGEFAGADTTTDLTLRTYEASAYFDECATCPHVYKIHRFRWSPAGFRRTSETLVPSPYSTFVQFIHSLSTGDLNRADQLVTDPYLTDDARRLGWANRAGKWRIAPGVEETPSRMVFYRGANEAFAVHFAPRSGDWLIAAFEPSERAVE